MKTEKSTQTHFKIIWKFLLCCFKKLKEWALHYRFGFLGGAAATGWGLMSNAPLIICYLYPAIDTTDSRLTTSLTVLFLSLPVLCLLWFFRTHDTKEQIQKTQANINTSMLHKAIDLALASRTNDKNQVEKETDNKNQVEIETGNENQAEKETDDENQVVIDRVKRAIGLKMLAQLRRTDSEFESQIDSVTKGLDLNGVNLVAANLRGINLREANLQGANLQGADLKGADLQEANLRWTHLQVANLQEANLRWTYFHGAKLQGAKLQGAHYDSTTRFPPDFNRQDAGMIDAGYD